MKSIIKNENAILTPLLTCLLSLAIVVSMYYMFMPLLEFISDTLILQGAPAATSLFLMKMARWGFFIFAIGSILVLFAKVWKKTHDTGRVF